MVGGTLGYNYQLGQIVLGVEADSDWAGLSSQRQQRSLAPSSNSIDDIADRPRSRRLRAWTAPCSM